MLFDLPFLGGVGCYPPAIPRGLSAARPAPPPGAPPPPRAAAPPRHWEGPANFLDMMDDVGYMM